MAPQCSWTSLGCCIGILTVLTLCDETTAATFTFTNGCAYTVWPGILSNAESSLLENGGFELVSGQSASLQASSGWSGRFWGRTGCTFSSSDSGSCASGDCGGKMQCQGAGAATPATLAEFSLAGAQVNVNQDFYDVSLVDGYNLPVAVVATGGSGTCGTAGCVSDINLNCPAALQVVMTDGGTEVVGCRSACDAFGTAEYCCKGEYANPSTCKPSVYSQMFKAACPKAYSYAYDDATSIFTCTGANYTILFCPSDSPSQNSVAGLQQPGSNLMGAQAYATASSKAQVDACRGPTASLIVVATVMAYVISTIHEH